MSSTLPAPVTRTQEETIAQEPVEPKHEPIPEDAATLRALFQHARFLSSGGRYGKRLGADIDEIYRLDHCSLDGVDLSLGNLGASDLEGATLRGATLIGVDFTDAVLAEADLTDARLDSSTFMTANLVGAKYGAEAFEKADTRGAFRTQDQIDDYLRDPGAWVRGELARHANSSAGCDPVDVAPNLDRAWEAWRRARSADLRLDS